MAKLPERFRQGWPGENAIYRTARKLYSCHGNGGPCEHSGACGRTIRPGDAYIEFVDSTPLYQRGPAISIPCAVEYGYIEEVG